MPRNGSSDLFGKITGWGEEDWWVGAVTRTWTEKNLDVVKSHNALGMTL